MKLNGIFIRLKQSFLSLEMWNACNNFLSVFFFSFLFHLRLKTGYLERGHESRLVIDNVTYDYQGEYECRATNYINGQERTVASEPVSLQVVGE